MIKTIIVKIKLRGTETEIDRVKGRIASFSACEECVSLYIQESVVGERNRQIKRGD